MPSIQSFEKSPGEGIGIGYRSFDKTSNVKHPIKIVGKKYISIGNYVYIENGLRMEAIDRWLEKTYSPEINVGDDVNIGQNAT